MSKELLIEITGTLFECEEPDLVAELSQKALEQGEEPLAIINQGLVPGMEIVGEKFQTGEYFLPQMVIAANSMQQAMGSLEPELLARQQSLDGRVQEPEQVVIGLILLGELEHVVSQVGAQQ